MSAAAYRDSWFEALPKPIRTVPISNNGSDLPTIEIVERIAPATPIA
jgi:hypothetical protein